MTPKEMESQCLAAIDGGYRITLATDKGQNMPPGFPKGELFSENTVSTHSSYKPEKVLRWLRDNLLIESSSKDRK
jgi:hypothetical protein